MTRENKLALVIGFGLILFIGILISDHFSVANNQSTADLTQPLEIGSAAMRPNRSLELLVPEIFPDRDEPDDSASASSLREMTPPADESAAGSDVLNTPNLLALENSTTTEPRSAQPSTSEARRQLHTERGDWPKHHLADRETLSAVARRYYGTTQLVDALAEFNGIADPDKVRAGHRLEIPPLDTLVSVTGDEELLRIVPEEGPVSPRSTSRFRDYEIQRGDILSKLAARFMGTGNRWKELYELNKDVIDDPDKLKEGTVIRVPAG